MDNTQHPTEFERSYPEEWHLENGNYVNTCKKCEKRFFGLNHRTVCKVCNVPKQPEPTESVPSAEEYLKESRKGLPLPEQIFRDHAINLMGSFANLRVEQEREKWEKQKQEALKASVSALYFDDSSDYSSYHYKVIMILTGEENPDVDKLYKILNHGK